MFVKPQAFEDIVKMMNEEENKGSTNKSKALRGLKRLISDLLFSVDNKNKDNGKVEKKVSVHKAITGNKRYGTCVLYTFTKCC